MFEDALIAWDDVDDPNGSGQHNDHNSVSTTEFETILTSHRSRHGRSRSSGRQTAWGDWPDGCEIVIVHEIESIDPSVIRPATAYESED